MKQKHSGVHGADIAVVVVGGANIDHKCQTLAKPIPRTSNPGRSRSSVGGVARNVADNLARLDVTVALVTAVGRDADGDRIIEETEAAGVVLDYSIRAPSATGSYTVILSDSGEPVIAVSSMEAIEELTPEATAAASEIISHACILVLDCNVPEPTLLSVARIAAEHGVPIVVDPVSVPKAARAMALLAAGIPIHTLTPNIDELAALSGSSVDNQRELVAASRSLNADGVGNVWVRRGERGSSLSCATNGTVRSHHIPAYRAALVDATGAGDAMLAGYVAGLLDGDEPVVAARRGGAAAAIAIESELTVSAAMSAGAVAARVSTRLRGA